jgi:hypothetical protein
MSGEPSSAPSREERLSKRIELAVVIILSLTAIMTAWTAFQSTKWSGEQANNYSLAASRRTESVRASTIAGQETSVDVQSFIAWLDASGDGNEDLAEVLRARFRDEFKPAFEAWLATGPFENPNAPDTPFAMPEYHVAATEESAALEQEASALFDDAVENNETADTYVLVSVVFALALFFGAISERFDAVRSQAILGSLAGAAFLAGLVFTLTLPIQL